MQQFWRFLFQRNLNVFLENSTGPNPAQHPVKKNNIYIYIYIYIYISLSLSLSPPPVVLSLSRHKLVGHTWDSQHLYALLLHCLSRSACGLARMSRTAQFPHWSRCPAYVDISFSIVGLLTYCSLCIYSVYTNLSL